MKVSAVMLADHATVREGLLHVLGAGITRLIRDPLPAPMGVVLAMMLQPSDAEDLTVPHNVEVLITHPVADGNEVVANAVMTLGAIERPDTPLPMIPIVVPTQNIPLTATGPHLITVKLDGDTASVIEFEALKVMPATD